jgi:hypothetical protein
VKMTTGPICDAAVRRWDQTQIAMPVIIVQPMTNRASLLTGRAILELKDHKPLCRDFDL